MKYTKCSREELQDDVPASEVSSDISIIPHNYSSNDVRGADRGGSVKYLRVRISGD